MAHGNAEFGMIKRRALKANPIIAKRLHKGDEGVAVGPAQIAAAYPGSQIPTVREVAAARVKIDHLLKIQLPAVVEIRTRKFDVPECGRFECRSDRGLSIGPFRNSQGKRVSEI